MDPLSSLYDYLFPSPQWILTPYAEQQLALEDPAGLQSLKDQFARLQAETQDAYLNAATKTVTDFQSLVSNFKTPLLIAAGIAVVILLIVIARKF